MMELPIFLTVTIILSYLLFFLKKSLSFLQNSIVFMVIGLITKSYLTIMSMELKLIQLTKDQFLFMALLMYRDLLIPIVVLIFVNLYYSPTNNKNKTFLFIGMLTILQGVNLLLAYFQIITFANWNLLLGGIVNIAYLLIGLVLVKILQYLQLWESSQNDNSL